MYVCTAELQCSAELRTGLRYTQLAGAILDYPPFILSICPQVLTWPDPPSN